MSTVIIANGGHVNDAVKAMEIASMNWNDSVRTNAANLLQSCADQINSFTNSQGIGPHAKS